MVSRYSVNAKTIPWYGCDTMIKTVLLLYFTVPGVTSNFYKLLKKTYGHISTKLHKPILELVIGVDVEEMSFCG